MPIQNWHEIQVRQLADAKRKLEIPPFADDYIGIRFSGTTTVSIVSTNAETSLLNGAGSKVLPADFWSVGRMVEMRAFGRHTMDATPPTITFRAKLGSTTLASVAFSDILDTNRYIELFFILTCRAIGVGGSVVGQGGVFMAEKVGEAELFDMVMTAPAAVDLSGSPSLDLTAQPSISDAGSNLQITNSYIRVLN